MCNLQAAKSLQFNHAVYSAHQLEGSGVAGQQLLKAA
jgi:hypothetical protein